MRTLAKLAVVMVAVGIVFGVAGQALADHHPRGFVHWGGAPAVYYTPRPVIVARPPVVYYAPPVVYSTTVYATTYTPAYAPVYYSTPIYTPVYAPVYRPCYPTSIFSFGFRW